MINSLHANSEEYFSIKAQLQTYSKNTEEYYQLAAALKQNKLERKRIMQRLITERASTLKRRINSLQRELVLYHWNTRPYKKIESWLYDAKQEYDKEFILERKPYVTLEEKALRSLGNSRKEVADTLQVIIKDMDNL